MGPFGKCKIYSLLEKKWNPNRDLTEDLLLNNAGGHWHPGSGIYYYQYIPISTICFAGWRWMEDI